jgi:hypothetical protein
MNNFNLEKALAGEKVVTRDGREVTQLVMFKTDSKGVLYGLDVDNDTIESWFTSGAYHDGLISGADLLMAPKKLHGFVGISRNSNGRLYNSAVYNSKSQIGIGKETIAIIDLSTIEEGHGL